MKYNYYLKKTTLLALIAMITEIGEAQETFCTKNFNNGIVTAEFNQSGAEWVIDNTAIYPLSRNYKGASGSYYYGASNGSTLTEDLTFTVSTVSFSNVTVQWGAYKSPLFPGIVFEWSSDGVTWNKQSFKDVLNNSVWAQTNVILLPGAAAGQPILRLRWSYKANNNNNYYAIDDIVMMGKIRTSKANVSDKN